LAEFILIICSISFSPCFDVSDSKVLLSYPHLGLATSIDGI
jgi:hypothetical protein